MAYGCSMGFYKIYHFAQYANVLHIKKKKTHITLWTSDKFCKNPLIVDRLSPMGLLLPIQPIGLDSKPISAAVDVYAIFNFQYSTYTFVLIDCRRSKVQSTKKKLRGSIRTL